MRVRLADVENHKRNLELKMDSIKNHGFLTNPPIKEFYHEFLGYGVHKSRCKIKIWKVEESFFVLLTDINEGTSVTNAAEQLVEEVYKNHLSNCQKEKCFFAETYEQDKNESIDLIVPKWDGEKVIDVYWRKMILTD